MSIYQRRIGKYELQERLGPGAVGDIWKAFDTQRHGYVAIKIIQINAQADVDFTPRFYREAQTLVTLRHPNIVPVQDFRISENRNEAYLIMDYVEGQSLADYLDATAHQGKFPSSTEIVSLLTPIAAALDYAHQHNIIHGALKPTAILFDKASATATSPGDPKLIDFGMNQMQNPLTLPPGDVHYLSPESAQGYAATSRSDIYSLGVMLYELCTGALPFQGDTPGDILMQHIHAMPTAPALINPHIFPALAATIMRSLARDPAARFSSATALVAAVARALNVSMPEDSKGLSNPSLKAVNPPSLSGIGGPLNTMNSPTYLSPLPQPSQPYPTIPASNPPNTMSGPTYPPLPPQPSQPMPALYTSGPGPTLPQQVIGPPTPWPTPIPPAKKQQPNRLFIALAALLVIVLLVGALSTYHLYFSHLASPPPPPILGHAFFISSGLVKQGSNQGITDELQINLKNIPDPEPGKRYYAWLLNDHQNAIPALLLGPLPLTHGPKTLTYIDPQQTNLLANYSHFLITEENATPTVPSLDTNTWNYFASFSTVPNPADTENHFSLYDHLRHLLAQDPKLQRVGLVGGLDKWLYQNTIKLLENAGAARDSQRRCTPDPNNQDCAFVRRRIVGMLEYLDGSQHAQLEIPTGTSLPIPTSDLTTRVALLEFDPVNQQPPGYLKHIGNHLRELTMSPGVTADQRALAIRVTQAIDNVQGWLENVHADALKLVSMDNAQLSQPAASSTLNDLLTQANYAFVGKFDPNTSTVQEGVVQVHYNIQGLATFDITSCINNGKNSCTY